MYVIAIDVIHALGFYTFGIKIDAIPGRINPATTLRSQKKGENRGFRSESRGQGHSSMLLISINLIFVIIVLFLPLFVLFYPVSALPNFINYYLFIFLYLQPSNLAINIDSV